MGVKVCTRAFTADYDGETVTVSAGEFIHGAHDLVRHHPDFFRDEELRDELEFRSERIAAVKDRAPREGWRPLSESGRQQQHEDNFWRSVERTHFPDTRTSAERQEEAFYEQALADAERSDLARIQRESNDYAELFAWRG